MTHSEALDLYKSKIKSYNELLEYQRNIEIMEEYDTPTSPNLSLDEIPNDLLSDHQFALKCMHYNPLIFNFLNDNLKNDVEFICSVIEKNPSILFDHFKKEFLTSNKFIQKINHHIRNSNGHYMKFTDQASRRDKKLILSGLKTSEYAFKYADSSVKSDYDFVISAAEVNGMILRFYWSNNMINLDLASNDSDNFYLDRKLTLTALKSCSLALKFIAPQFKKDEEIISASLTKKAI